VPLTKGSFSTAFFKDKKSKRNHKTVRIKVLLTIFADDRRIKQIRRIRIRNTAYSFKYRTAATSPLILIVYAKMSKIKKKMHRGCTGISRKCT
jgi:hypothetical protein